MGVFVHREAIDRIKKMEKCFEMLTKAEQDNPVFIIKNEELKSALCMLIHYYENGQWLHDYELDEKGLLPKNLKRGILAQDTVYDFLERIKDIKGYKTVGLENNHLLFER